MCKNSKNKEEKIVNLFEDTGNFHDEESLDKSYKRTEDYQKDKISQEQTEDNR